MAARNEIKEVLGDIFAGKILYDEPMSLHTSLAVGGSADAVVFIENEDQLAQVTGRLREKEIDFYIAGNLTNVIVRDGGYRGAVLLMTGMKEVGCEYTPQDGYVMSALAGAALAKIVSRSVAEELTGLEFCAGIPGSVGGAVWMNAGAYGKEMKDVVKAVSILNTDGEKKTMNREEISFGYRRTSFPVGTIILGAKFKLEKGERSGIKERINDILQSRQAKHPLEFPSAGSVFKNMPGQAAGKLIEDMGLKGMKAGGAQISSKHANFIVNRGNAAAADILGLVELIQIKAKKERGVNLETEVVIIGED
ncbi:MAG: UDP-N-acetylenolpyruvoylglucosamine reductase [Deltaproteobacteria bacterium HGW-Deltaproteobacteria-7]|jgi:UDP-N-acetylmuramate dehydrogenase|nr:MAG: UDP-N-acetylenolpyruvoylglucosamine reductase [Deltaproteobacteria bacterium HGW-Deltaproteobacteria-7]PKN52787.1 MAG: UDP-N-acetylenolpyruvoylglucosamine reductase [Deltaproteobacteria bacterium HGW-Deltaproteobacteria-13]